MVVAAVSGGASALSALITGTLALLATRRANVRGSVWGSETRRSAFAKALEQGCVTDAQARREIAQ